MLKESFPVHPKVNTATTLVDRLIDAFNREEIVYSHWKSNIDLAQAKAGKMDLDLLVDRKSLHRALIVLAQLGFKAAVARRGANPAGICHYYGLDLGTDQLVHVHLFTRVLTGESYVKSHLFPFEAMLLENVRYSGEMRVASRAAELVLFTLRIFIKYGSLFDLASLWRKSKRLRTEVLWLQGGSDLSEALSLLRTYCPVVDERLFAQCIETLNSDSSLIRRIILAQQVRRRLKVYSRETFFERLMAYAQMLSAEVRRRLGTKQKNKVLQAGGAVIAFVGADATGKSTLVANTGRWLGDTFAVKIIHTGKPPSSWLTTPVNLLLALLRRRRPLQSAAHGALSDSSISRHEFKGFSSIFYGLRAVVLAWDRQRLIVRTRRRAAKGEIIICDRYPSNIIGAMDSPRLEESLKTGPIATIYNGLARLEKGLYQRIPPPDIVLRLKVSIETARKRNRNRDEQDGDLYLETRHRQSQDWQMSGTSYVFDIDTDQTLEQTICSVKSVIWAAL
jgi:thymidylate kinase